MSVMERRRVSARRDSLLGDEPGAFAVARFVRVTPQKARRVVDLVRGLPVDDASDLLRFAPQSAAETVYKVLESAVANAEGSEGLDRATLVVSKALVDEGPTLKRFRPRAQGRAYRIRKRSSHITVVVQPVVEQTPPKPTAADTKTAKKTAAKKTAAKSTDEKATATNASADTSEKETR